MSRGACSLALAVLVAAAGAAAGQECPPGLRAAAREYGQTLQRPQWAIRDSGPASPEGVEETVQFSLADHACHRGPGQAYREFGEPVCLPGGERGRASVRYPFQLHFRKALTLEALFRAAWAPGTDGALQVEFEREGERWIAVGKREVLPQVEGRERAGHKPVP